MVMKKKIWKKIVCAGLILAMTAGLCACSREDGDGTSTNNGNGQGGTQNANSALAKENVYRSVELSLGTELEDVSVRASGKVGDTVYLVTEEYAWKDNGNRNIYRLISMSEEGTMLESVTLIDTGEDTNTDGDGADTDGDGADTEGDEPASPGGAVEPRTAEADIAGAVAALAGDADFAVEEPVYEDTYEYTNLSQIVFTETGRVYGLKTYYFEDYSNPDSSINETSLICWDTEGNMIQESILEGMGESEEGGEYVYSYVSNLFPMSDGTVMVHLYVGEDRYQITMSEDGTFSERRPLGADDTNITYNGASGFIPQGDDTALIIYYNEQDNYNLYITSYDIRTNTYGEGSPLPASLSTTHFNTVTAGTTTDLVFSTSNGIFTYNMGDADLTKVMDYVNSDVNTYGMDSIVMLSDTQFIGFYYDQGEEKTVGGLFTYVAPEDIPDKAVLVIGGTYIDYYLKRRTVQFNKSSDTYRIVLRDYSTYNTNDDYTQSYTQLNNDIISGNMPDILVADDYNLPLDSYISKGLFADVDALIAADPELSQTTFMDNVFEAYRVDGKLYYVIPNFYINVMVGKQSLLGDRTSITLGEVEQIVSSMPEGAQMVEGMTRSNFIYYVMNYCGANFVDMETGECHFDSEDFIAYLEYAKTLPEEFEYSEDYWMTYESMYREDRTLFMDLYLGNLRDVNRTVQGNFGEDISFVGFPSETGENISIIQASNKYALSAQSDNLQGAWDFISYYLTEEYQSQQSWILPTNRAYFDTLAQEAMTPPYYLDENGEKVEYEDTYYINGESVVIEPMSQELLDKVVSYIESVDRAAYSNDSLTNIITEEAESFFSGQKPVEEVVDIIQRRATIYVSENQ